MTRGLVVDFGGVLTTSIAEAFRDFCEREGIDGERLGKILEASYRGEDPDSLVALVEVGAITQQEFETRLAEALSLGLGRPVDADRLVVRMLEGVELVPRMIDAVRRAREGGIRTALLSNSWSERQYRLAGYEPEELFDAIVISARVRLRKPDLEMYRLVAARLDLPPEDCVFVDDIEENVTAAERAGMRGIVHEDPDRTIALLEEVLGLPLTDGSRAGPGSTW